MTTIKVVCAWCGADMGEKDGKGVEGISHGMCEECAKKENENAAKLRRRRRAVMSKGKTRDFKDRQCRYCASADKLKFRRGEPCCLLLNPRIRNGHCLDRWPTTRPISVALMKKV